MSTIKTTNLWEKIDILLGNFKEKRESLCAVLGVDP